MLLVRQDVGSVDCLKLAIEIIQSIVQHRRAVGPPTPLDQVPELSLTWHLGKSELKYLQMPWSAKGERAGQL